MFFLRHHKSIACETMTSTTVLYRGYSVTSSLDERSIFLKFINQVSFIHYEANVEPKDLRLQHNLPIIYKMMMDTFADNDENFKLDITIANGFMKLAFHALFSGYLDINFEVALKEKVITADAQLTLNIHKLEQDLRELKDELREKDQKIAELLKQLANEEEDDDQSEDEEEEEGEQDEDVPQKEKRVCSDPNKELTHRLPGAQTLAYASRVAINADVPVMLNYWIPSLEKKALLGQKENGEKALVLSDVVEYTDTIQQIYCSSLEYIVLTEEAVYIVSRDICMLKLSS